MFYDFSDELGRWFEGSIFIFGEQADLEAAILFNDVTEKKKAEDELNESRIRYQDLIETNYDF
jgi:PAS domain-containing protein